MEVTLEWAGQRVELRERRPRPWQASETQTVSPPREVCLFDRVCASPSCSKAHEVTSCF